MSQYGVFLTNAVDFILVAAAIFFFVVLPYNAIMARRAAGEATEDDGAEPDNIALQELPQRARDRARHLGVGVVPEGVRHLQVPHALGQSEVVAKRFLRRHDIVGVAE